MIFRLARLAFSRAPSQALRPNSASAATIAIDCGLGLCAAAASKNPVVKAGFGFGPVGIIEKYLSYLNSSLMPVPNRLRNSFFLSIITGIAGAICVDA